MHYRVEVIQYKRYYTMKPGDPKIGKGPEVKYVNIGYLKCVWQEHICFDYLKNTDIFLFFLE